MPTELGSAHGTVTITAELDQAARQIAQFSQQTEQQFNRLSVNSTRAQQSLTQLAGAFGIGFSVGAIVQGVVQLGKAAVAATEVATAYERQMVAAENLAGSQEQLNALLEIYDTATGGALSKADQLANVTQLMAVGFADSTQELDQFATAIRGISIAMGTTQDTVTQNLILELFTQRGARLDQLGLQYNLIRQRAEELQDADAGLTQQMAYQQAVLEQANERFGELGKSAEGAATGVERLRKAWDDFRLVAGQEIKPDLDQFTNDLADLYDWLVKVRLANQEFAREAEASRRRQEGEVGPLFNEPVPKWMTSSNTPLNPALTPRPPEQLEAIEAYYDNIVELERNTANERLDAVRDYGKRRADMIEDYEKNLTRSAANYAKQRARAVEDYEKSVARLQRDAQAQQLRMAEDHERNLARMREDHAQRLGDLQEDLDTRISERRAESAERLADFAEDRDEGIEEARERSAARLLEIEEDYTRSRTRAVRQHEDTLSEAASRLDARAIYNEQRRFAREQEEAAEAHQEKVDDEQAKLDEAIKNLNDAYAEKVADEKEALQKSIEQAQIAYDKQVADANEAFAQREQDAIESYERQASDFQTQHQQRLTDMETDFREEMTQRDGDQADRIAEMKTDHQENLTELDTEHGERLLQIGRHAEEERTQLDEEFEKELAALGDSNFDLETEQHAHQVRALKMYQDYLDDREREEINANIRSLKRQRDTGTLTPAEITALNNSITALEILLGRIGVEPGRHVNPRTAPVQIVPGEQPMIAGIAGTGIVMPPAVSGGATIAGMAVTIAPGAIVINAAPGESLASTGDYFEQRLLTTLRKVAKL